MRLPKLPHPLPRFNNVAFLTYASAIVGLLLAIYDVANGDEDVLKRLGRFTDPRALWQKTVNQEKFISSHKIKTAPPIVMSMLNLFERG